MFRTAWNCKRASCRRVGRYRNQSADPDNHGDTSLFSGDDTDLRIWPDTSFIPAREVHPAVGNLGEAVKYLFFPALAIALPKIAMVVKFLRNSVISEMNKDYVRTAFSKGNTRTGVLYSHILKNALIPVITFFALVIAEILAGSIIVEQVFSVPGIGRLLISSISNRDYPVVQAIVLYITAVVVIINFIVDVLYQFLDPRVKTS